MPTDESSRWGLRSGAREVWAFVRETFSDWSEDGAPRLAAALAYYTIFSLGPLLIVSIALAGIVFGREAVQGQVVAQLAGLIGPDSAEAIEDLIARAQRPTETVVASIVGFATLLFGAAGVVGQLKVALNTIWDVPTQSGGGVWGFIRSHLMSFALVLAVGFVLLVSLVISAALAAANSYFSALLPGHEGLWMVVSHVVSLAVITLLFALMFKYLPDARVAWTDVWVGAFVTAVLFEIGKLLVSLYLGQAGIASAYGAAGSLVVIMVWVYYTAQILFVGAEFTQVYARRRGSRIVAADAPDAADGRAEPAPA
jgi:membrane protein